MATELPPRPPKEPRPGALGVTTPQQVMVSVLSGAAIGYLLLVTFDLFNQVPPVVPWSLPIVLVAVAIPAYLYARALPDRIEGKLITPEEGVRAMVLGKSMLMTGCVLSGGHLVYVLKWIGHTDAPGPRERVVQGAVAIVAAIAFALIGWVLEKACVVDSGDGDSPGEGAPA